jgi:hypothetical protein
MIVGRIPVKLSWIDRRLRVDGSRCVSLRASLWVILQICGVLLGSVVGLGGEPISAGPFAQEYSLTLAPGWRREGWGPLLNYEEEGSQVQWGMAPLYSVTYDSGVDWEEIDFLYPLFTLDRFGQEYRIQFLQVLSFAGGQSQRGTKARRFTLFPLYFQQRSENPQENYTAVFPFYGELQNRLMRDNIRFVLFPVYAQSRKKDVVTDNVLFPVFHLRRGDALRGWQFWPLYGEEHKGITTRTNSAGDFETVGGHDKRFVLWPFFFNQHTEVGTTNEGVYRVLLPFFSMLRSPRRDSTTVLWPLFTVTDDREKQYREWDAPWPLVVFARGEGKTANRVWPLFGEAQSPTLESDFYLWPLYKYNRFHSDAVERDRVRIGFFLYSDITERGLSPANDGVGAEPVAVAKGKGAGPLRRTDLWPLFTARIDHQGNQRFQMLEPVEPMLPNNKSIERNYSPVWSLWRSEKTAKTGATSESVFWNLYRYDTTPATKKGSLLFGLFQYQSTPEGKQWRLFYVPVTKGAASRESRKKE